MKADDDPKLAGCIQWSHGFPGGHTWGVMRSDDAMRLLPASLHEAGYKHFLFRRTMSRS